MEEEKGKTQLLGKYADILYRIAFSNMKNKADAEDVVQEAYFRYLKARPEFQSGDHERAWFIRVVVNICKDMHKSAWHTKRVALDEVPEKEMQHFYIPYVPIDETLWQVMELPSGYSNPLYLFYYEDCSIREIAQIMELEENTVKTRLRRGREMLKERLLYGKHKERGLE